MDESVYNFIQDNAVNASKDDIERVYAEQQGNVVETISVLLDAPKKPVVAKTEWEERRDVFDEMDRMAMAAREKKLT